MASRWSTPKVTRENRPRLLSALEALGAGNADRQRAPSAGIRERFTAFDDRLAARGVLPLTAWWRSELGVWLDAYEAGTAQELLACVGRGAAKSTALYKLALFFTLYGDFRVPPGERHFAIVLSRLKEEAGKGVQIIHRWLSLLGVGSKLAGDVIELDDQPRGIRVVAASVAATSGWRAFFVGRDERAKWPASLVDGVSADEIDTSSTAMTATHARAPIISVSSAWLASGSFYEGVSRGTQPGCIVIGPAATWIAAPHITAEELRRKDPRCSPGRWRREYECEFQEGTDESLLEPALLDAATVKELFRPTPGWSYVAAMDPGTRSNAWTLVVASNTGKLRQIVFHHEWMPEPGKPLDPRVVFREMARMLHPWNIRQVHTDQWGFDFAAAVAREKHEFSVGEHIVQWPIDLILQVISPSSKLSLYEGLAFALSDHKVGLPDDRRIRQDLLGVRRMITPTGQRLHLVSTADGRHSDFAQPVAMACSMLPCDPPRSVPLNDVERIEQEIERAELRRFTRPATAFAGLRPQRKLKPLPK